jgi:hypothetical protein
MGSGYPFPVLWHLIPANIDMSLRFMYSIMLGGSLWDKRIFLKEHGIENPLNAMSVYENSDRCLWISQSMKQASYPLAVIPSNAMQVGPVYLSTSSASKQDAELAWLEKGPTLLINMGSKVHCTEETATELVKALRILFDNVEEVQMLWKLKMKSEFGDRFLSAVSTKFKNRRLRLENWLNIDQGAIMETGNVACMLHQGGADSFNDAIGYVVIILLHFCVSVFRC